MTITASNSNKIIKVSSNPNLTLIHWLSLFPSLFPSSREKGAEAERALINFFLLKLKSYIKTLFPTHFPYITALLFLEVGEREDNRTIKYQIYPDYNWEEESYKPIPGCYNQQKRLEHQQI